MSLSRSVFALLFLLSSACKSTNPANVSGLQSRTELGPEVVETFVLKGHDEKLLVMGSEDFNKPKTATIFHLGKEFKKTPVVFDWPIGDVDTSAYVGKSRFGLFYLAFQTGEVVVVDSENGSIVNSFKLPKTVLDIEVVSRSEGFVSYRGEASVDRIDLKTGKVLTSIALGDRASSKSSHTDRLYIHGENLFVGVSQTRRPKLAKLYIVDIEKNAVKKSLDLYALIPGEEGEEAERKDLLGPLFVPVYEKIKNTLLLIGASARPINGIAVRIDLDTLELKPSDYFQPGTFTGQIVISNAHNIGVRLGHTSTPTASTHPSQIIVKEDGSWQAMEGQKLFDLFSVNDALTMNQSESIATIPIDCGTSVCTHTEGVDFIDLKTGGLMPQLSKKLIGYSAQFAIFAKD